MVNPINSENMNAIRRFFKMNLLIFFFLSFFGIVGFTQTDAGPDKIICKGGIGSVEIGPTYVEGNCYFWEPDDGSLSDLHVCNPIATPDQTKSYSEYTLTIVGPNFCSKNSTPFKMKVYVLDVRLEQASFTNNNHTLYTDDGTYANNGTGNVRVPQILYGQTSTAICYTWESSPSIDATFSWISDLGSQSFPAIIKIDAVQGSQPGTLTYTQNVILTSTGITPSTFTVEDQNSMKLKKIVDNTTYDLTWEISVDNGTTYCTIATTSNKLYVTAGPPGFTSSNHPTIKRIDCVTSACKEFYTEEPQIVNRLWSAVIGQINFSGNNRENNVWYLLDNPIYNAVTSPNGGGDCISQVTLFQNTIWMTGKQPNSGNIWFVFADIYGGSHAEGNRNSYTKRDCGTNTGHNGNSEAHCSINNKEILIYSSSPWPYSEDDVLNYWEACYKYRAQPEDSFIYYAGGTNGAPAFTSYQAVMNAVRYYTLWIYVDANWQFMGICDPPGPFPEYPQ
jgi:hypothetical protein